MSDKTDIAIKKFADGYNCAQSVLYAFCNELNLDEELALKLACGFGSGMGRNQEVCGAVTGGILVIGTRFGRGAGDDRKATELTYKKTKELMDRFADQQGTYLCRKLLNGCNLQTDEGQKQFKEQELMKKVCTPCVQTIVDILENILSKTE